MSRVITFSRFFPKTHPKAGNPTFFVEKFWKGLQQIGYSEPCYFLSEFQGLGDVLSVSDYAVHYLNATLSERGSGSTSAMCLALAFGLDAHMLQSRLPLRPIRK